MQATLTTMVRPQLVLALFLAACAGSDRSRDQDGLVAPGDRSIRGRISADPDLARRLLAEVEPGWLRFGGIPSE